MANSSLYYEHISGQGEYESYPLTSIVATWLPTKAAIKVVPPKSFVDATIDGMNQYFVQNNRNDENTILEVNLESIGEGWFANHAQRTTRGSHLNFATGGFESSNNYTDYLLELKEDNLAARIGKKIWYKNVYTQSFFNHLHETNSPIKNDWNLSMLDDPLGRKSSTALCSAGSISSFLTQPGDMPLLSYLVPLSHAKLWVIVPRTNYAALNESLKHKRMYPCTSPLLHNHFVPCCRILNNHSHGYFTVLQKPGEIMVIGSGVSYITVSLGITASEEVNLFSNDLIPTSMKRKRCTCTVMTASKNAIPDEMLIYSHSLEYQILATMHGPNIRPKALKQKMQDFKVPKTSNEEASQSQPKDSHLNATPQKKPRESSSEEDEEPTPQKKPRESSSEEDDDEEPIPKQFIPADGKEKISAKYGKPPSQPTDDVLTSDEEASQSQPKDSHLNATPPQESSSEEEPTPKKRSTPPNKLQESSSEEDDDEEPTPQKKPQESSSEEDDDEEPSPKKNSHLNATQRKKPQESSSEEEPSPKNIATPPKKPQESLVGEDKDDEENPGPKERKKGYTRTIPLLKKRKRKPSDSPVPRQANESTSQKPSSSHLNATPPQKTQESSSEEEQAPKKHAAPPQKTQESSSEEEVDEEKPNSKKPEKRPFSFGINSSHKTSEGERFKAEDEPPKKKSKASHLNDKLGEYTTPYLNEHQHQLNKQLDKKLYAKAWYAKIPEDQKIKRSERDIGRSRKVTCPISKWFDAQLQKHRRKISRWDTTIQKFNDTGILHHSNGSISDLKQKCLFTKAVVQSLEKRRELANILKRLMCMNRPVLDRAFMCGFTSEDIIIMFFAREYESNRFLFQKAVETAGYSYDVYAEIIQDKKKWAEYFGVQPGQDDRIPWEEWDLRCENEESKMKVAFELKSEILTNDGNTPGQDATHLNEKNSALKEGWKLSGESEFGTQFDMEAGNPQDQDATHLNGKKSMLEQEFLLSGDSDFENEPEFDWALKKNVKSSSQSKKYDIWSFISPPKGFEFDDIVSPNSKDGIKAALDRLEFRNVQDFIASAQIAFHYWGDSADDNHLYGANRLYGKILKVLEPGQMLSNIIVQEYLKMVEKRSFESDKLPTCITLDVLDSKNLVQRIPKIKWMKADYLFAAVLLKKHFYLFVADLKNLSYFWYDSLRIHQSETGKQALEEITKDLVKYIRTAFFTSHSIDISSVMAEKIPSTLNFPIQQNSTDCGIFVIQFAEQFSRKAHLIDIYGSNMVRRLILAELLTGYLFYDAPDEGYMEEQEFWDDKKRHDIAYENLANEA